MIVVVRILLYWVVGSVGLAMVWAIGFEIVRAVRRFQAWYGRRPAMSVGTDVFECLKRQRIHAPAPDYEFAVVDHPPIVCPACLRMRALHVAHPRLTVPQLDAIVRRQIALDHCRAHSYADAPD